MYAHYRCDLQVVGEREAHYKHDCFLSMIEIYNENIRDLLADPKEVDSHTNAAACQLLLSMPAQQCNVHS